MELHEEHVKKWRQYMYEKVEAGVQRFILISSIKVTGEGTIIKHAAGQPGIGK